MPPSNPATAARASSSQPGTTTTLRPARPDPGRCTPPDQPQPDRQQVPGDVTAPCAAQTPPPEPTAAGPDDGRVRSSPSWRIHEPCTCTESVALRLETGLTGSGRHRYSLGGFGGGHSYSHVIRHSPARLDMSCARPTCYRQVITASLLQTPVVAGPASWW